MTARTDYLHWSEAGGPNECEHGYAEGIPCPHCDAIPLVVSLRAKNERLLVELTHRVGWEERCLRAEAEKERLRTALQQIAVMLPYMQDEGGRTVYDLALDRYQPALPAGEAAG